MKPAALLTACGLLSACGACSEMTAALDPFPPPPPPPPRIEVPVGLRACPLPTPIPPVPEPPRTIMQVLTWTLQTGAVATANADALSLCRRKVFRLNDIIEKANDHRSN